MNLKMKERKQTFRRSATALVIFLICFCGAFAQTKKVTGNVSDSKGEEIIGASILVKGTTTGTVSDIDGNFSLNAPESATTLVVSYVGMQTKEVAITGALLKIVMDESAAVTDLDEVVVIGYGTVKKRDLTGSVSSISAKELKDIPVTTAAEAITGKMAGVQVTTIEGSPDAEVKIRVRGGGSITGDNTPLYIVDGFPVNSINDISPSDIQSIDVLKDASSTAIYGARGANGVIIITTKAPKEGRLSINYNGLYGFKKIAKKLDVLSPYEFAQQQYELAVLRNKVADEYVPYFGVYEDMDIYRNIAGNDWQEDCFGRTGNTFTHNISMTGGTEKSSFNISYNRTDDRAIMMMSKYSRDNLSIKYNAKPIDRVKLNVSARYSDVQVYGAGANEVNEKSSSDSRLKNTVIYSPISLKNLGSIDSDDEEVLGNLYPPAMAIADNYRYKRTKSYYINGGISLDILKNLSVRSEIGLDNINQDDDKYYGTSTYYVRSQATLKDIPAVISAYKQTQRLRNTNTVNYNMTIDQLHSLSFMLGEETLSTQSSTINLTAEGIPAALSPEDALKFTTSNEYAAGGRSFSTNDNLLSFFGRANYDYLGKYIASATFRYDGSSKFAPGNQWGFFPSAALAWRVVEEDFMSETKDWLSNLKLRLSYGTAGNNNISADQWRSSYTPKTTSYLNIAQSYWTTGTSLYNPDLKWETTVTRNLGLDFGFLNQRISGSVELFSNDTKDLLINFPIQGTGYSTQTRNAGSTSNKGIEGTLNFVIINKADYGLDFGFNIGYLKNKVKDLGGLESIAAGSAWNSAISDDYRVFVGQSLGLMYGYVTDGFYSADDFEWTGSKWQAKPGVVDNSYIAGDSWGPGALKLKDLKEDGSITSEDRTVIGNATPKFTGGFNLSARYRDFDFSAAFSFVYGNDIYNANKIEFTSNNATERYRNMITEMSSDKRWTNIDASGARVTDPAQLAALNANATIWSPYTRFALHSWAVEDGSFLRLNNLTVGYSLPRQLVKKASLQQVRFFYTGNNLLLLTNYSGYDPEVDTRRKTPLTPGVDYSAYPKSISHNFGVNITF